MKEDVICFIWKYRLFSQENLYTEDGQKITIIFPGQPNNDSGPDFFAAKIRIGDTLWVGNVEVHVRSSDWQLHKHYDDKAYDNVILHVVYSHDARYNIQIGNSTVPTVELKKYLSKEIIQRYNHLMTNMSWIPCESFFKEIDYATMCFWLSRMAIERLEKKALSLNAKLLQQKNHWNNLFYESLARNFGFHVNADPFEQLARATPQKLFAKHKGNLFQIEALIFGQSGLLTRHCKEDYPKQLKKEYDFLRVKYNLKSIQAHLWKFMRLRPRNFPTIRLAQWARLIASSNHLFSTLLEKDDLSEIRTFFRVEVSEYWQYHYHFGKTATFAVKPLGEDSIDNILLNTVVLFLFLYGQNKQLSAYVDRAIRLLEELEAEKNAIVAKFKNIGFEARSALQSQGLMHLKKDYCDKRNCLNCVVGIKILNKNVV